MGALTFASPLILVALLALPALWLLLRATPPAPKRVAFPAFEILRRLKSTDEQPQRTPWPVLLLRLLTASAAILAFAGPVLDAVPVAARNEPLLIVLDDSYAAAPDWSARRDALISAADEAAESGREIRLIRTASPTPESIDAKTGEALRAETLRIAPQANAPDYKAAAQSAKSLDIRSAEIRWLSDGLAHPGADDLLRALAAKGDVAVVLPDSLPPFLAPPTKKGGAWRILDVDAPEGTTVVALARDGREIGRAESVGAEAALALPLALENEVTQVRIDGVASAGSTQLVDARSRRALVGIADTGSRAGDPLLSGGYYIEKALAPYAEFVRDRLDALAASDASVIVIDDIGVIRPADEAALRAFLERGGVIVRFAGQNLAQAAENGEDTLLPVDLRGGGRAFGGALTWETPQQIGAFADESPLAGLALPADARIRRQVLAEPGGETSARSWAMLEDGTPLVTAQPIGQGVLVLVHVTATPEWSDLPLSATFVDILRRLVILSSLGPALAQDLADRPLPPWRVLDGFGVLRAPDPTQPPLRASDAALGARPGLPAGLYGSPDAPIALNVIARDTALKPFAATGVSTLRYEEEPPLRLGGWFAALALVLFAIDCVVALVLAGKLRSVAAVLVLAVLTFAPEAVRAQTPLDPPISEAARAAALNTRLAFVKSGDASVDRISEAGLAHLSRTIARRTSVEPAAPAAVDPEADDLSPYQFLYWPIVEGAEAPSAVALANIENFMRFGGLVVFDTRDDERAAEGATTPARLALRRVLTQIDMPPLAPPADDHVLLRSFYLLDDLPGRMALNRVFVQAEGGANDDVTPVIIGGRDWAGAWAADALGNPILPMSQGGEKAREMSLRAGVNMVMVALTGNYKSDQVHAPILLERIGR
jgi:hypothetical protein